MSGVKNLKEKLAFSAYEDLFETDESREDNRRERIYEIPLTQIKDFPNHPYYVKDDDSMTELVESVKERGLFQPVIVRPLEESDTYEMVSGHRRKRAYELAGIEKIPCRVLELTRDEAIIIMVESNFMRETILPSEKAFAYKMRMEAMKRQGKRTDLTFSPTDKRLNSAKEIAESSGESQAQIYRYIRLTELTPELLQLVDEGRMKLRPAVEISYLTEDEQRDLLDAIDETEATPSHAQAIRMRKLSSEGNLNTEIINSIMCETKPNQKEKPLFRDKRILEMIPKNVPVEKQSEYVMSALEYYNKYLQKKRNRDAR